MRAHPQRSRRARGSRDPETLRPVFAEIDHDAKAVLDGIADAAGAPLWLVIEECARHLRTELTDQGLPEWWPTRQMQQEALDIPA